jgi:hypothetical protein
MAYPDASIQSLVADWWVPQSPKIVERGALILFAVPYVDIAPQVLTVRARTSDRDHTSAEGADLIVTPISALAAPAWA